MLIIFLVAVVNYADRWVFSVVIEPIKAEFGVSDTVIGLLTGPAFAILYATVGIPLARLADLWNRRTIVSVSVLTWSAMTVFCGMATSLWQLFIFRVGVGIGEAGATPPSQSLIADYYPADERTGALAVFNLGPVFGALIAGIAGSALAASVGWRATLIWMGLPGIFIALLAWLFLKETREPRRLPELNLLMNGFGRAVSQALRKPSFVHLLIGFTINGFLVYGAFIWTLPYALRTFDIPISEMTTVAVPLAFLQAFVGLVSIAISGWVGNHLGRSDIRWLCGICAFALVASFPVYVAKFWVSDLTWFFALAAIAHFLLLLLVSPAYACIHLVIGSANRALVVAFVLFASNIVGMGAGPLVTGILSDLLFPLLGDQSLQAAILILLLLLPWAGFHFLRAAKFIRNDLTD